MRLQHIRALVSFWTVANDIIHSQGHQSIVHAVSSSMSIGPQFYEDTVEYKGPGNHINESRAGRKIFTQVLFLLSSSTHPTMDAKTIKQMHMILVAGCVGKMVPNSSFSSHFLTMSCLPTLLTLGLFLLMQDYNTFCTNLVLNEEYFHNGCVHL